MKRTIWFDMDGTIADLYSVENWLPKLRAEDASPYAEAKVMLDMNKLAHYLNRLHIMGYRIGIISWTSKVCTPNYANEIEKAKKKWLRQHLASVPFDVIHIVPYGTPKLDMIETDYDILFDDEEANRKNWLPSLAFTPSQIFEVLRHLMGMR